MTLKEKINALAESLLDSAYDVETTKEQVEIFKAAITWYLGARKADKGDDGEESAGGTFDDLRQKINGTGVVKQ